MCGRSLLVGQVAAEPVESFVKAFTAGGACALNEPVSLAERMESELVGNFSSVHGIGQILFVGENEQNGVTELVLSQHAMEFIAGLANTISVVAIDDKDDALSVLEVMAPEWANLVLTTNIPHREADVLVLDSFHIESDGWDCGHDFAQLELVENSGLTRSIKSHHEDAHLLLAKQILEELCKG